MKIEASFKFNFNEYDKVRKSIQPNENSRIPHHLLDAAVVIFRFLQASLKDNLADIQDDVFKAFALILSSLKTSFHLSSEEFEDLVADTICRLFAQKTTFEKLEEKDREERGGTFIRENHNFLAFVKTVATRIAIDYHRQNHHASEALHEVARRNDDSPDCGESQDSPRILEVMVRHLDLLDPQDQRVLKAWAGSNSESWAADLAQEISGEPDPGLSRTLRTRRHRALRKLMKAILDDADAKLSELDQRILLELAGLDSRWHFRDLDPGAKSRVGRLADVLRSEGVEMSDQAVLARYNAAQKQLQKNFKIEVEAPLV